MRFGTSVEARGRYAVTKRVGHVHLPRFQGPLPGLSLWSLSCCESCCAASVFTGTGLRCACCCTLFCAHCHGFTEAINTGPLEATIHNLGKEIEHKTKEGQDLQRRWITKQTELVALQVGHAGMVYGLSSHKYGAVCTHFTSVTQDF